jgi:Icc-related predicted phosphoesterase
MRGIELKMESTGSTSVPCLFVSDLHGRIDRYEKLFAAIDGERPALVFLGGDLLPLGHASGYATDPRYTDFTADFLIPGFRRLGERLGEAYPRVFLILGNDDPRSEEPGFREGESEGLWTYAHGGRFPVGRYTIYGYACVPPTPFRLKDWERYDVSRYVPPGCVSPEEGRRSVPVPANVIRYSTIEGDLRELAGERPLEDAVFLFHTPPQETALDRAALDGKMVDHVPLDLHVGSFAVRRFIDERQPLLTLHGHVHESARLTGAWRQRLGRTLILGAAHDGPELALVRFDLADLEAASRTLV